jgi:aminopeptidase
MTDFDSLLDAYSELIVRVGLNVRAGQRVLIIGPLATGGVSLEAAPLVRKIAARAYEAGSPLVEVIWGDESLQMTRFRRAPRDSFTLASAWLPAALVDHVDHGNAVLSIYANDPDQLQHEDPQLISSVQQATARAVREFRERVSRNDINWSVAAAAVPSWAKRVFPNLNPDEANARLWEAIARLCRLDAPDPVSAWRAHLDQLAKRRDRLNQSRYHALRYRGPGTDLTIGLAEGHTWVSGQSTSRNGILFAPNIPTEEVFTMPHKDRVDGVVRASRPLSYGGSLIEDFSVRFEHGRVVDVHAAKGETVLKELIATDGGAARLGEVALVPFSSPVSLSGLLFYNTLFDENAASHVALGAAYRFTLVNGESMDDERFGHVGGNRSAIHVDFMIGSADLDIDGVWKEDAYEPLMRRGEWVG